MTRRLDQLNSALSSPIRQPLPTFFRTRLARLSREPHAGHPAAEHGYAIDFDMPIRTEVIAARGGTVVDLEERFVDGDRSGSENFLLLEHEDGTVARYVHLTQNGALAEVGDLIAQGDVIALSGDTGRSNQPHLHFDVIPCCCVAPPAVTGPPCDQTMPITFRNTRPHPCGVVVGDIYVAEP